VGKAAGTSLLEFDVEETYCNDYDLNRILCVLKNGYVHVRLPTDSMWIEPETLIFRTNTTSVGDKFNVTVWLNITFDSYFWQVKMLFNPRQLKAVRVGYTAGATSNWATYRSGGPPVSITPVIDNTAGYVLYGESLYGGNYVPAPVIATLFWAEFQITSAPPEGGELTSILDITTTYPRETYIGTPALECPPFTPHNAYYKFSSSVPPTIPLLNISDYYVTINNNVAIDVAIKNSSTIAGGSFELYFDNRIVEAVSVSSGDFGAPVYVIDNNVGVVKVAAARGTAVGKDIATLVKVTFKGLGKGFTLLQLQNAQLNDEEGNLITPVTESGSISVKLWLKGDLNHNDKLDTGDATLVLRIVVGLLPPDILGDMNNNGKIDTGDATIILRKVVGLSG
jgi:hypothetical protein